MAEEESQPRESTLTLVVALIVIGLIILAPFVIMGIVVWRVTL